MNRELKFRAWDKKLKQYIVTGFYILGETTAFNLIEQYYRDNNIEFKYGLEFLQYVELEQFTGLKDKNGIDIYEGDILKIKETPFQIEGLHQVIFYEDRYLTYSILYNDVDQANKHPLLYQIEYADAHVIGNIYDNPELLNK